MDQYQPLSVPQKQSFKRLLSPQMNLHDKVGEYEANFHWALTESSD